MDKLTKEPDLQAMEGEENKQQAKVLRRGMGMGFMSAAGNAQQQQGDQEEHDSGTSDSSSSDGGDDSSDSGTQLGEASEHPQGPIMAGTPSTAVAALVTSPVCTPVEFTRRMLDDSDAGISTCAPAYGSDDMPGCFMRSDTLLGQTSLGRAAAPVPSPALPGVFPAGLGGLPSSGEVPKAPLPPTLETPPSSAMVPAAASGEAHNTALTAAGGAKLPFELTPITEGSVHPAAAVAGGQQQQQQQQQQTLLHKHKHSEKREEDGWSPDSDKQDPDLRHVAKQCKDASPADCAAHATSLQELFDLDTDAEPCADTATVVTTAATSSTATVAATSGAVDAGWGGTHTAAAAAAAATSSCSPDGKSADGFVLDVQKAAAYEAAIRNEIHEQSSKYEALMGDVDTLVQHGMAKKYAEYEEKGIRSIPGRNYGKKAVSCYLGIGGRSIGMVDAALKASVSRKPAHVQLEKMQPLDASASHFPSVWRTLLVEPSSLLLLLAKKEFAIKHLRDRQGNLISIRQCDMEDHAAIDKGYNSSSWRAADTLEDAKLQRKEAFSIFIAAILRSVLGKCDGVPAGLKLLEIQPATLNVALSTTSVQGDLAETTDQLEGFKVQQVAEQQHPSSAAHE